ncbi:hypothetical protein A3A46_00070 [Candidatus Roizmanbacteria bacterium RIFCSPLOWO2_01_FULL_37_13]|uniref:Uncharacterized protein n=1 Tax=Candidatus Roizmanbacteria bacterium RIFCSPHIGHO2_02_FULL_38_11 TaxID=1802039 RepID=A0A1F7H2T0_9BACT|nr:MAG: hypothetical protein A3C25_04645 [Candidatus Roizmanbacteria bacterium RIFCSPHIGHO2_02_FULL_38_11]OGK32982.1 MAG: hypothetical protein A3F58_03935 [Candidatus Roizmanbacteria bacterium RIFCSPHIGHO2_12_FULL_37_9b]OGK42940.1 MAG: hypothetical protein A3A46_00070 [Candidatus Roizmanbacteria bacterium RIFCSPLOWO2_01_FULL_37_13]
MENENIEQLENQAVDAAINFNWKLAIDANKRIIKLDKKNLAAQLRLGFTYIQLQKFDEAKKFYRKALKIQPNSNVAKINLERLKVLQSKTSKKSKKTQIYLDPNIFLEISGKTKSVSLVNLGQKNILAALTVGQEIFLKFKKRKVEVRTRENEYVGGLPDDLSRRLLVFLKAKSKYRVFVKEASLSRVTVFIHEEKKGKKVQQYLSFPQNIQSKIAEMQAEKEGDEDSEEETGVDLEKLAESLTSEEKEYLPYKPESDEEESEE